MASGEYKHIDKEVNKMLWNDGKCMTKVKQTGWWRKAFLRCQGSRDMTDKKGAAMPGARAGSFKTRGVEAQGLREKWQEGSQSDNQGGYVSPAGPAEAFLSL